MNIILRCIIHILLMASLLAHPDPSHTLQQLEEHLKESPNDASLLKQKAELFLNTGHPDQARPIVEQLLSRHPDQPQFLLLDVQLYLCQKKHTIALAKAQALTSAHPTFSSGWKYLGIIAAECGEMDSAINAMRRHIADEPKPSPTDVLTCAAWMRDRAEPEDAAAAISLLDQGLAKLGMLSGLQYEAIKLEVQLTRYDSALRRIDALAARFHPSVDLSLRRADVLEKAGRHQEAAAACDSALALLALLPAKSKKNPDYATRVQETTRRKEANLAKVPAPPHDS